MDYRFASLELTPNEITRRTLDMWADLAFDDQARARLRRDGIELSRARLTGPCPYRIALAEDGTFAVSVLAPGAESELLDLWRLHFMRGLRLPLETH